MSLESDVGNLVTKTTELIDYFRGQRNGIDNAVKAAIAAVPDSVRIWWVDPVAGLDTNAGNVRTAPFKTIGKAMASTPNSGHCVVNLLGDYTVDSGIAVNVAYLTVFGVDAMTSGVTPKLKFKYVTVTSSDNSQFTQMNGFSLYSFASNVELRNVDLDLPSPAGLAVAPVTTRICSVFKTNSGGTMPPVIGITLQGCKITKAADFFGVLIGHASTAVIYQAVNCTFPSDMAGKHISSVAAGTDLKILTNIMTNLGSL